MANEENRLLKSEMILHGDSITSLALYLGIAHQTLSRKIAGNADFTQSEMNKIKQRYQLSDEKFVLIFSRKGVS